MSRMTRWGLFSLVFLAHLALSVVALLWTFGISSDQFAGHAIPALASDAASGLLAVTWFPLNLFALPASAFPGLLGWIPVIGNSLIWAAFVTWVCQWLRRSSQPTAVRGQSMRAD